ncbi:MAG: hypothetical protein KGI97_07935 [Alphaproteobacteria bacterium]|nr:hypothetical protein [Alphaproteobacteria bacterium]
MKILFPAILCAVLLSACAVQKEPLDVTTNLNKQANLVNQGIALPPVPPGSVLDGIPLMQGLQVRKDKDLLDILPGGANPNAATAIGIVDVDSVYDFYARTLPTLGWKQVGPRDYMHNGRMLHINARARPNATMTTVTFAEKNVQE